MERNVAPERYTDYFPAGRESVNRMINENTENDRHVAVPDR